MTAYNEVNHDLRKWPTTLAIATQARAAEARSSVARAAAFLAPIRVAKLALRSAIASPISERTDAPNDWAAAGLGDWVNAWGFA